MAAPSDIQNRYVILPWAQASTHDAMEHVFQALSRSRVQTDSFDVKVDSTGLPEDPSRIATYQKALKQNDSSQLETPPLGTLPYSPAPQIPTDDRPLYVQEELVSIAVALDVLSTTTRSLELGESILSKLAEALLSIGNLSGATAADQEALVEFARSNEGAARESLALQLSDAMDRTRHTEEEEPATHPTTAVTPLQVRQSLTAVENMADQAILEAYLLIESQQLVEYRQA